MADKRISELTSATSLGDADVFPLVQSGETKKLTGSALKSYAQSGVVLSTEKGANSGVATLGSDGKLTASQLPDLAVSDYLGSVATQSAMLALTGQKGDWAIRSDLGTTWVISGNNPSLLASWTELSYPTAPVTSVAGKTGAVSLVKGDVGLGNVDNTSDANKPISSAAQTALDAKQAKVTASGLLKGDGNGGVTAAASGTDYLAPSAVGATIVSQTGTNGAAALPSGTTAQRPASPVAGNIRYNASTGKFEGYGSAWGNIGGGAAIGDAAPSNPGAGDLWWNSLDGHLYVYYSDVDTSQWVDAFAGGEGQYLPLTGGTISGNLGVGIIASSNWQSTRRAVQIARSTGGGIVLHTAAPSQAIIGANHIFDGTDYKYLADGAAGLFSQLNGGFTYYSAPAGTAGQTFSPTPILALNKSTSLALEGASSVSGTGISFPATQLASSDANTLDDYEEGTWTPTITGSVSNPTCSYNDRIGYYRKIGSLVYVDAYISTISLSGGSGNVTISGLPFSSQTNGAGGSPSLSVYWVVNPGSLFVIGGTSTISVNRDTHNAASPIADLGTGNGQNYLAFSLCYRTS